MCVFVCGLDLCVQSFVYAVAKLDYFRVNVFSIFRVYILLETTPGTDKESDLIHMYC